MNHANALWIITADNVGTGCVGRHSPAFTAGDEAKCTVEFLLFDEVSEGKIYACYLGKIAPEFLDEDIEFDLPHDCWTFIAVAPDGWSVKHRNSERTNRFRENQEFRIERDGEESNELGMDTMNTNAIPQLAIGNMVSKLGTAIEELERYVGHAGSCNYPKWCSCGLDGARDKLQGVLSEHFAQLDQMNETVQQQMGTKG